MSGSFCLWVYGRLHGLTRQRLEAAVSQAGGRLMRTPGPRVDTVALGHGTALVALSTAPPLALPENVPSTVKLLSEGALKRILGLTPPLAEENRTFEADALARAARLDPETLRCLAAFDVLEPVSDRFGFRDLAAAREVRRLIEQGFGLEEIGQAAILLRRSGRSLADTRLSDSPWGEIVQEVGGRLGRLDGQYTLALDEDHFANGDELFEAAETAEAEGDLEQAERLYRLAMRVDRSDPVIPFNLGNVLDVGGRPNEAALAYQEAIARDCSFAEAWLNLAALDEARGRITNAIRGYERALQARPGYAEALHNLAGLLTAQERYKEALPYWSAYLALIPRPPDLEQAARMALLCRAGLRGAAEQGLQLSPCNEHHQPSR